MKTKMSLIALLSAIMVLAGAFYVQAVVREGFSDVEDDFWAKSYIEMMNEKGIIKGYDDNTFKPYAEVTREEFAKMMVLSVGLELQSAENPTFEDVEKGDWAYKYIETAKTYLTGYQTAQGLYFRPTFDAQREDMAVAIVKALGIDADNTDLTVLSKLNDENTISKNLRKYVAAAINEGIMVGDTNLNFGAKETLTRAESAVLLGRLINGEKVVFDETKVVVEDTSTTAQPTTEPVTQPVTQEPVYTGSRTPVLSGRATGNGAQLSWSKGVADNFNYYKVVFSLYDSTPSYPENGYQRYISDVNNISAYIESGSGYSGGDVGGYLKSGKTYYVTITAVYNDGKFTSNVLRITMP